MVDGRSRVSALAGPFRDDAATAKIDLVLQALAITSNRAFAIFLGVLAAVSLALVVALIA